MNLAYFISSRISRQAKGTFSSIISRIAVISVAVAVSALLLAFMILGGFQNNIKDKVYDFSGHLLISKFSLSNSYEETPIRLTDSLIQQIDGVDKVKDWQPFAYKAGLLKTKEEVQGVLVKGLTQKLDTTAFGERLIDGKILGREGEKYSNEVVISKKISEYLSLEVGDNVLIYFIQNPPRYRKLSIVGIYETSLEEFDDKVIYCDIDLIRRLNGWSDQQIGGIEVFLDNTKNIDKAQDEIFEVIGYDLKVENVADEYLQIFDWLKLLNTNVVIVYVLIICVAGFSMISILLILIMERTQMIGILKSLGGSDKLLRDVFLSGGLRLIVIGLLWGNAIAIGFGLIQDRFEIIPLDPVNYYMKFVPIEFNLITIGLINISAILLIGATLLIPLRIITKIEPVRTMRFD